MMRADKIIPILRIFDYEKAKEFYVDWLGFQITFEHYFEPGMPVYMEVMRENITFHLSEHHGDGTPGSRVFLWMENGVAEYHEELKAKNYKYNRPGLHKTFYDALSFQVSDPFGNHISFNEKWNPEKHEHLSVCED